MAAKELAELLSAISEKLNDIGSGIGKPKVHGESIAKDESVIRHDGLG